MFRQNWAYDPSGQDSAAVLDQMIEILQHLDKLREQGKVRQFGLSNETAWGTMRWLSIAATHNLPRMVSVQNEYSLLCRFFDLDMAEVAHHEQVGLLAFSPLAAGLLSGKYAGDKIPAGSRRSHVADLGKRVTPRMWPAVDAYCKVAEKANVTSAQLALAWARSRPFMTSVIIGATTPEQVAEALESAHITLSEEILKDIAAVHRAHPMPF